MAGDAEDAEPADGAAGFAVRITDSAVEANGAAAEYASQYGSVVEFDSRSAAADLATLFSRSDGTAVSVQAAAPQDASDIDAYLVARPERRTHEPSGSIDTGLTFDTTPKQFGTLGETLITAYEANPPLLVHYARRDLDRDPEDPIHVEVDADPAPVAAEAPDRSGTRQWVPDCRAVVRSSAGGRVLREYLCEIKTGGGSLERDQLAVMQAASRKTPVLKIQLDIAELPDSYTARVRRVSATDLADDLPRADIAANARLDEFS